MVLFSPLEQYEIIVLKIFKFFNFFQFDIINSFFLLIFLSLFIFFYFNLYFVSIRLIPTKGQLFIELLYKFALKTLKNQTNNNKEALKYFPLFFYTFLVILTANLLALQPFSFSLTGQLIITFLLAFSFNLAFLIIGLVKFKFKFFLLFKPKGTPIVILPLIFVIELLSYCMRPLSLGLRLFANMMAGHTLIHIISSFLLVFINLPLNSFVISLPFFFFALIIFGFVFILELAVAFIQAYVFFMLLCIYLNDAINGAH